MFKSRYLSARGKRGKQPRPDWAVEVEKSLVDLGLNKTELAEMLDCNYSHLVCILSGSRISPATQERIIVKINELKSAV